MNKRAPRCDLIDPYCRLGRLLHDAIRLLRQDRRCPYCARKIDIYGVDSIASSAQRTFDSVEADGGPVHRKIYKED